MSIRSVETGSHERTRKIKQLSLTALMTPYQRALYGNSGTRGTLMDMLQSGLEGADFVVSKEYDLGQLNRARTTGHVDIRALLPLDEESLPPAAVYRMYFSPVSENREDRQPLEFAVIRGNRPIDPSRLASVQLDPAYEPYFELERPQGKDGRFRLVLRNQPAQFPIAS